MPSRTFLSALAPQRDHAFQAAPVAATTHETTFHRCRYLVERITAVFLLFALSPLIAVAAVAVRLTSRGPAFYSQVRLGWRGRHFKIYKLRTMRHNCEAVTGPRWSGPNDDRVTPLGRFLRRSKLDELPQLWNIAAGEMAFIGPRPERPEIAAGVKQYIHHYDDRISIRPGLTGLAQVLQNADVDLESVRRKVSFDRRYIHERSVLLDLRIVVGTVFVVCGMAPERAGRCFRLAGGPLTVVPHGRGEEVATVGLSGSNPVR